jgi:hypothetical protein
MRYPRWFRLLLAAFVLHLGIVDPVSAQDELSFNRQDIPLRTFSGPFEHRTGDFNGDNQVDLSIAQSSFATAAILLGNGDGTFAAAPEVSVGGGFFELVVADFNGDGRQDLATTHEDDTLSIHLGNGDGTFRTSLDINTGGGQFGGPRIPAAGDFNADGAAPR